MHRVSCIIPAYNEEKYIGSILMTLCPLLGTVLAEIIVIDDCSSDSTKNIVRKFSDVTLIEHMKNEGKSRAVADGIERAVGTHILMIDGDLRGLEAKNIQGLVNPVLENRADISISHRGNTTQWWIRLFKIETFSGERCFAKDLLFGKVETIRNLPGYGLEVYINEIAITNRLRIDSVEMKNVSIPYKWHKHGILRGVWKEILMWRNIFTVVSPIQLVLQVFKMQRLLVR